MADSGLRRINQRLIETLERDSLVQKTTNELRTILQVDRVVLYYFYPRWQGQVTFEALSSQGLSILGSTGPDECFNAEYAALYLEGRIKATVDIETEPITECHREFLRSLQVRANLVAPILNPRGLWGLLIAHHCQTPRSWDDADITAIKTAAEQLESNPVIEKS